MKSRLKKRWSPEQISNRLLKDFPDSPEMHVSTETIYQAIYKHADADLRRELGPRLRRGRTARKSRRDPKGLPPAWLTPDL